MKKLADEIIHGRRLTGSDDLSVLVTADLKQLCEGANDIRKALCGDRADLCSIINGRSGRCSENCRFCAQAACHHADCEIYGFLEEQDFMEGCAHAAAQGIDRYSIVTAGRTMSGDDLEKAICVYRSMHKAFPDMVLCASHGLMRTEDLKKLKEAGVTMYHTNIETSESYFPHICTSHTFHDKTEEIRRAREAGLCVCSGGILGMGESWEDRLSMALTLSELAVSSIPLNFLIPIPKTPLENMPKLLTRDILRITAIFRYINPSASIRIAAGRNYFKDDGKALFSSGANATLTGDMLTTTGNKTAQDRVMLTELGFQLKSQPQK